MSDPTPVRLHLGSFTGDDVLKEFAKC